MRKMQHNISEDFLDAHDPSELVQRVDVLPEQQIEHADFTDIEPEKWYRMCAESPEKYNVMFAVQFQAECNLRADKRHVKEIERVMTLILGRRSEMSTFNVSTADAVDVLD
jgi:hypothetical protein